MSQSITLLAISLPQVTKKLTRKVTKEILDSLTTKSLQILRACANEMHSKEELFCSIGMTAQTNNVRKHLTPLIAAGLLTYEDPSTPTKRGQRYCTTERGILALNILNVT